MSKKIKIGVIGDPKNIHLSRRLLALGKEKFDLSVISPTFLKESEYEGLSVFSVDLNKYKVLRHFRWCYAYYRFIRAQSFDAIYCFGALLPLSWLAGLASKKYLAVTTIGVDIFLEDQIEITCMVRKNIQNLLEMADVVTVLSFAMKTRALEDFKLSAQNIMLDFLDIEDVWYRKKAKASSNSAFPIILSPRMLAPLYQQKYLLEALVLLKEKFPNILLLQTGFGRQESYYKECLDLVEQLNLKNNVKFLDVLDDSSDLIDIFDCATCVIMIPKSDGMPASMVEAWARKKPVIVSNIDNYEDTWDRKFFLKTDLDPESLKDAVIEIVQNAQLKEDLILNSTKFLQGQRINFKKLDIFRNFSTQRKRKIFHKIRGWVLFFMFLLEPWFGSQKKH